MHTNIVGMYLTFTQRRKTKQIKNLKRDTGTINEAIKYTRDAFNISFHKFRQTSQNHD